MKSTATLEQATHAVLRVDETESKKKWSALALISNHVIHIG